jgi:Activator of Hsp90 ATPase homolog 1-like protein
VTSVVRVVEVRVDPAAAFHAFTEEIDEWYGSGPYSWNDPQRAVGIRFEPGLGGRLVEIWDRATGEGYDMGRVIAWEPGRRVAWTFRNVHMQAETTEVDVRFEETEHGTRVTLEHSGLEVLPEDELERSKRYAWKAFMQLYSEYVSAA